ncbi:MAG: M28 family peptidase [candidate division Zixibacteria bacterium]|nr:M28 family peptidase [candidate division Zixibacteria bacterium]
MTFRMGFLTLAAVMLGAAPVVADKLVEVTLRDFAEAQQLEAAGATAVAAAGNLYLAVISDSGLARLTAAGVEAAVVAQGVAADRLAIDRSAPGAYRGPHAVVFARDRLRLVQVDSRAAAEKDPELVPITDFPVPIRYSPARPAPQPAAGAMDTIDSLVALVSEDSLRSYTERLQAFYRRVSDTDSSRAARDWLAAKFAAFGYDSVVLDYFDPYPSSSTPPGECCNVVACRPGAAYPEQQIVIGAHYDAVASSPGADDNASGTAAVLELARVLAGCAAPVTLTYIPFDAEESGLLGSRHYADSMAALNREIVLMVNFDMIGHETNDSVARVYFNHDSVYADLWVLLAPTTGPLVGDIAGYGGRSDHVPFGSNGYDFLSLTEDDFSTHYHSPSDSTTYLNFDYVERIVRVSLAAVYAAATLPPPVPIAAIRQPGDGRSLLVEWRPLRRTALDHYRLCWYRQGSPATLQCLDLPPSDSIHTVEGLTEGAAYIFYVQAFDSAGQTSLTWPDGIGIPQSRPAPPEGLTGLPIHQGVALQWGRNNQELDLSHYAIYRDGALAGTTSDTVFQDQDPGLGEEFHEYLVAAVDDDGIVSDTIGRTPFEARAATLTPGRILAINRDNVAVPGAEVALTGEFLRAALAGAACDYRSDSAYADASSRTRLYDLVSYELVVVAGETFYDNVAFSPAGGGLLDTLAYYLAIGGKLLVFGRFGPSSGNTVVTIPYAATAAAWDDAYSTVFHLAERSVLPLVAGGQVSGDLVGAHPQQAGWPALPWDSLRTAQQEPSIQTPFGICAGSFVTLNSSLPDVLYTYDSGTDDTLTEGKAVAWRYLGADYRYIWFDLPLSFFDEAAAIAAVHRAVNDLTGTATALPPEETLPDGFALTPNYPNPFNPRTTIGYTLPRTVRVKLTVYNLLGQQVRVLVDGEQAGGRHEAVWDGTTGEGRPAASGVYLYRLETPSRCAARKMLLLK